MEGYAADWTIEQLREPAKMITDRIKNTTMAEPTSGAEAASRRLCARNANHFGACAAPRGGTPAG